MTLATRDNLFATAGKRRYAEVSVGGATYRLQSLTEGEKSQFETDLVNKAGVTSKDARKRLLILTLVDADNQRLLTSADLQQLDTIDGAITSALFNAAMEHVGFDPADIDELVGNSEAIRGDSLPSA